MIYISKDREVLNDSINYLDVIDSYKTLHGAYFSTAQKIFTDHLMGHKTSLNEFKMIEILKGIYLHPKELNQKSIQYLENFEK